MKPINLILFAAFAILASCSPESPAAPKTVTFQGITYEFSTNYQNYNSVNSFGGGIDIMYVNQLATSNATNPFLGVGFGFNSFADSTLENFSSFLTTGNKTFQTPGHLNGAFINIAAPGFIYSSNMASQSGSTFNFTSLSFHTGNPDYIDYSADFSCKVYDWTDTTIYYPISGSVNGQFVAEY